ncbi:MAG: methyltransferase domain-containing protein [Bdellovibrionaceae bacterium]|nr:methyltransferase domain-containing protein [Pseudobdellovibrionaceae bacterium]
MVIRDLEKERNHWKEISENKILARPWESAAGKIRKRRRVEFLLDFPNCNESMSVLEIGAGSGIFTSELTKYFKNLTAIDLSQELLDLAKVKYLNVNFRTMDAHQLAFPDNSFDAVLGVSILHHLDWDMALQSIFEKLKPGGWIRFSEPNLMNPQIFLQKNIPWLKKMAGDSPDEYAFTSSQIIRSLTTVGFSNISAQPFEFLHPSTPPSWVPFVQRLEDFFSMAPTKIFGGSLLISARKPDNNR